MAGTPGKRAKREALKAAAAQLPQAAPPPMSPPAPSPGIVDATRARDARARARPQPPTQTRSPAMGRTTHAAIDEEQAKTVRTLAHYIKPGLCLRLSRTRPTWAMGFIEDYPVNVGESLSAFYEYVRDTHGGQTYRVEVLGSGDVQMFEGGLSIAGPVRVDGRVVSRAKFEGRDDDERPRDRRDERPARSDGSETLTLAKMLIDQANATAAAQLASVKDMVTETRTQTRELMQTVLQTRDDKRQENDLGAQLGRIVDAVRSVDKVKKVLGGVGSSARRDNANEEPQGDLQVAEQSLKKAVFDAMAQHVVGAASAGARARAPAQSAPPTPGPTGGNPRRIIPDARSAGQGRPEN